MTRFKTLAAATLLLLTGCSGASNAPSVGTQGDPAAMGYAHPLANLTADQLASYNRGKALFSKTFGPADGLGPVFNNTSCLGCHGTPDVGGATTSQFVTLAAGDVNGANTTLKGEGGPGFGAHTIAGMPPEELPADAAFISKRIPPPTFGAGLISAIATDAITAQLAPTPLKESLGIHGEANWEFTELGRFGWKAQKGDMVDMSQQAAEFELGLSSPGRPREDFPNIEPQDLASPADYNNPATPWVKTYFDQRAARGIPMTQPDLSQDQVTDLVNFQMYSAPLDPLPLSSQAQLGQQTFASLHCDVCHVPSFQTADNHLGIPAGLKVPLYSDLLVHDMGPEMDDGLIMGVAKGTQWRTAPLWGLRFRDHYLHDGRATTLDQAIRFHGGEGAKVRDAYIQLSASEKAGLMAFLNSL